jgi:hypothetical protein
MAAAPEATHDLGLLVERRRSGATWLIDLRQSQSSLAG